jgi:hypothetical protein
MLLGPQVHASLVLPIEILCSSRHPIEREPEVASIAITGTIRALLEKPPVVATITHRLGTCDPCHTRPVQKRMLQRGRLQPQQSRRRGRDRMTAKVPHPIYGLKSEEHTPIGGLRSWLLPRHQRCVLLLQSYLMSASSAPNFRPRSEERKKLPLAEQNSCRFPQEEPVQRPQAQCGFVHCLSRG